MKNKSKKPSALDMARTRISQQQKEIVTLKDDLKAERARATFHETQCESAAAARKRAESDADNAREELHRKTHQIRMSIGPLSIDWCGPIDALPVTTATKSN